MRTTYVFILFILTATMSFAASTLEKTPPKPNVIIILADDMGYGDAGFNGCKDIPTPHLDSIAKHGVRFSAGYVTAPQCAPSRSGLLSGRYQNRFGCEENNVLDTQGIPRGIRLFGDYMRLAGYRTGMVGKWHLGTIEGCHPLERGFDFFYGFLGGGSFYLPPANAKSISNILCGREPQVVTEYLTTVFGEQAVRFIENEKDGPFFLYLAFNAPHTPMQAPASYLKKFDHIADPMRKTYAAMVSAMDDAVGGVLACLRKHDLENKTLIAFLADNGGPTSKNGSCNAPFRGVKGDVLDGGTRVPFVMQWKSVIPAGQTMDTPVLSLDLLPTALAAAGATPPAEASWDGRNLLPLLTGKESPTPRAFTWRFPLPPEKPEMHVWGVRQGDWKLVKENIRKDSGAKGDASKTGLYFLADDITESNDLSGKMPEKRKELQAIYDAWTADLPPSPTEGKAPRSRPIRERSNRTERAER